MDYKIFNIINQFSRNFRSLDKLMLLISNKVRFVFIFALFIMWFKNQSYRAVTKNSMKTVLLLMFMNKLIKILYYKPRPFEYHRVGILMPSKRDSSFPSKHTLLAFAVSTTIFLKNRILGSIFYCLSLLTGFSRIWIGHHYPSDIIGSAILGSAVSCITNIFSKRKHEEDCS